MECPYFEFDECQFSYYPFSSKSDRFFDSNANQAHDAFSHLATDFSAGIQSLSEAHGILSPFGYFLLPVPDSPSVPNAPSTPQGLTKRVPPKAVAIPSQFDVAISFAGTERELAQRLATRVRDAGFAVFYDDFYPEQLWGRDLVTLFDDIYRKRAKFCVVLISAEYCTRMWTNHERKSVQAKALQMRGEEYILPVKVDESELPGLQPTIGYLSLAELTIDQIAELLIRKLSGS